MLSTLALVAILGLASYRISRLLTADKITESLRQRVAVWAYREERDEWRSATHQKLVYFATCPFCVGVYVSAIVFGWWELVPGGRPVVLIAAVAGLQSMLASRPGAST